MNLRKQIEDYKPYCKQEEQDKKVMLEYFDQFDDVLTRENRIGHFSSSAFAVNQDRTKVIMIYHNIYHSWAWTGGHADGEEDLLNVAIKELKEETGVSHVKPISEEIMAIDILSVDGHVKRGKYVSTHVHLNVVYFLEADETDPLKIKEDENSGVKWVNIDEMVALSTEANMKKVYQKLIDKMRDRKI